MRCELGNGPIMIVIATSVTAQHSFYALYKYNVTCNLVSLNYCFTSPRIELQMQNIFLFIAHTEHLSQPLQLPGTCMFEIDVVNIMTSEGHEHVQFDSDCQIRTVTIAQY